MSLAPLLQVRLVLRRRNSAGVSVVWIAVLLIGFALWLSYGAVTDDGPLVITNIVSFAVAAATLAVIIAYRPRAGLDGGPAVDRESDSPGEARRP
jgi:uncharacterized protein with PQ loop repeat